MALCFSALQRKQRNSISETVIDLLAEPDSTKQTAPCLCSFKTDCNDMFLTGCGWGERSKMWSSRKKIGRSTVQSKR